MASARSRLCFSSGHLRFNSAMALVFSISINFGYPDDSRHGELLNQRIDVPVGVGQCSGTQTDVTAVPDAFASSIYPAAQNAR
jgi:hypothetical protein